MIEVIAFVFSVFTLYGCGPKAVLYGFMMLVLEFRFRLAAAILTAIKSGFSTQSTNHVSCSWTVRRKFGSEGLNGGKFESQAKPMKMRSVY